MKKTSGSSLSKQVLGHEIEVIDKTHFTRQV